MYLCVVVCLYFVNVMVFAFVFYDFNLNKILNCVLGFYTLFSMCLLFRQYWLRVYLILCISKENYLKEKRLLFQIFIKIIKSTKMINKSKNWTFSHFKRKRYVRKRIYLFSFCCFGPKTFEFLLQELNVAVRIYRLILVCFVVAVFDVLFFY